MSNLVAWEDLHLFGVAEDSDGFLGHTAFDVVVVDDDREVSIDEVMCQQVATFSREFIEVLIKGHEVLVTSDGGMS